MKESQRLCFAVKIVFAGKFCRGDSCASIRRRRKINIYSKKKKKNGIERQRVLENFAGSAIRGMDNGNSRVQGEATKQN